MAASKQTGIYVEGSRQLRKTLRAAGDDLSDLKEAHRTAGRVVAPTAKNYAPARTGNLRSSVRVGATKTAAIIRAGKKKVPYAGPIHWGWFRRNIRPTLFIARAAKDTEPVWVSIYMDTMNQAINKVQGK